MEICPYEACILYHVYMILSDILLYQFHRPVRCLLPFQRGQGNMAAADAGNIAVFRRRRQVQVADDLVAETAINIPLLGDDIVINLHRLRDDTGVLQGYLPFPRYVDIQYARKFATDKDLFHQGLHQTRRFPAAVFVHLSHGHGQGRHLIIWSFHGRRNGTGIEDIAAEIKAIVDTGNDEVRPVL